MVFKEPLGTDAGRRLQHELAMLGRLAKIDGIARVADGPAPPGVLALQDLGATPLSSRLRSARLEPAELLALALQLVRAVASIHRAGVIHRDINPANIVVSDSGELALIDFDLAIGVEGEGESEGDGSQSQGRLVGTLAYLAPEQTGRTGRRVDPRSDLYALGATLYEMATGSAPFEASDTLQLIHDHLVTQPLAPRSRDESVPADLSNIIMRLLAKAPEARYQSAEGLAHDLARCRDSLASGASSFPLGERDFAARLVPPAQLVGREAELALLRGALDEAMRTPRRTVLIEGAAGVGKSALIHGLRPIVARAGGWFIEGKFDQLQREGAAAGGVTQALAAYARLLLALPREEQATLRRHLLQALGSSAGVIARLAPEFSLLLGDPEAPPEIDPRQSELRLHGAIVAMLGVTVSPARPLVVVLDDLQWAGAVSLRAFERLMGEPEVRGVLLVGSYRSFDADESHVLAHTLRQWREHASAPSELSLSNLGPEGLRDFIAAMLRLEPLRAQALAPAIGALTGGNPFDTVELCNAMRKEGVLTLEADGWRWQEDAVRHFVGHSKVVDLLAARISRLPAASRELLDCMSCLGNSVDPALLGAAAQRGPEDLREGLRAAVEDGLLVLDEATEHPAVRFRHDRVQQAVLDAMDAGRRQRLQLAMARRLAGQPAWADEAAQQFLACGHLLQEPSEQAAVAGLFFGLSRRLADRASFLLAERFLAQAGDLLVRAGVSASDPQVLSIAVARHAALYSLGRLEESDPLYEALSGQVSDALDLVEPTCLQMRSLDMRGRMDAAMALGLDMLRRLGVDVPDGYEDPNTEAHLDSLGAWIAEDARLDPASRPQIRDPRLLAIAKVLGRTVRSALVRFDTKAIVWLLLESRRLWTAHGPCPELVACLGRMSGMLISLRQDYGTAYAIAHHALGVGQALGYTQQTAEARFIFATYACHWFEPVEHAYRQVAQGYATVQAGGDASFACYVHLVMFTTLVEIAPTAAETLAEIEAGIALCGRTGNLHAAALHASLRQTLRALAGLTGGDGSFEDEQFSEESFLARAGRLPFVENSYAECRAMHALIMGEGRIFSRNADRGMAQLANLAGYYMTAYAHFFVAIARAWELQSDPGGPAAGDKLAALDASRSWLSDRAQDQPYNFLHLLRLVEAERAWALGDLWGAATAFDSALAEAGMRSRPWHRAVITERAGLFHLARGLAHTGRDLLAQACAHYAAWGAHAKVATMQRDHAFLSGVALGAAADTARHARSSVPLQGSGSVSPEALDLLGVLRASQALSSETSLERLAVRVTDVLAALSGATKVQVLLWSDNDWWLPALAPGKPGLRVAEAAAAGLLALSAVRYAELTEQPLSVDDACRDDRFARDAYFAHMTVCSLLLVPISGQGSMRVMLYLENSLGRAAFNSQRLDAVMLIAGQLAVSLANAQLYESLERRVQARTLELEQAQAQLVTTARRAGKAEIATNVLHNVGNVLNSINVSASVVRRTISESRVEGLTRAVALINEHEADLPRFMGADPRGKALTAYLNELVGALRSEQETVLGDLERLTRSVDHISYVVATQQSHAGPSSVLETVRPLDLVEEALRMKAEAIDRAGLVVVRRYEDVPPTELDRQRLLQILVNLIANASQAMEETPPAARMLTLGMRCEQGGSGGILRITVQDAGEGILAENLPRIFAHGFTTRAAGHGFGLHSSALAAVEMGGRLTAHSEGKGRGAVFVLEIPIVSRSQGLGQGGSK